MSLLEQLNLSASSRTELGEGTFERLRAFIYQHTGIYFQDNKRYLLESRLSRRLNALRMGDFGDYMAHLQNGGAQREMPLLVNAITINETYFFRNVPQLEVIEQEMLPELVRRREQEGNYRIRIWSAGSSTGDEAYTLAIVLHERLQARYPRFRFEIVGTDINTDVVEVARAGVYGAYAVRNTPPQQLARYFKTEGDRYILSPEVRKYATFKHLNLMDRVGMQNMRDFDIIICANVLIYFDAKSKQQVVSSFYNSLSPGGYLMIGFSETLYGVTQAFQPVRFAKTIAYKKG